MNIYATRGQLVVTRDGLSQPGGLHGSTLPAQVRGPTWLTSTAPNARTQRNAFVFAYSSSSAWSVLYSVCQIVLWPFPIVFWTAGAFLLRSAITARRRATTNACRKCGYSLAGLDTTADRTCPECGYGAANKPRA